MAVTGSVVALLAVVAGVSHWTADSPEEAMARYAASATARAGSPALRLESSAQVERSAGRATYRLHWQRPTGPLDQLVVVERRPALGGLDARWTVLDSGSAPAAKH